MVNELYLSAIENFNLISRFAMQYKRLITAATWSIIGLVTILITPKVLSNFNETKSVGQHIIDLHGDFKNAKENENYDFSNSTTDYHSNTYKNWSMALDIIAYGSLAFAFVLGFISMLKSDHKYAHYVVWMVCIIAIGVKLTFLFAGVAMVILIVVAAIGMLNG
jgi:hypothetical protein